ncbi:YqhR family membrane protein [Bacillus tianshenii]|nr:YqhR family membrane protein [Bacillus tianshenii]
MRNHETQNEQLEQNKREQPMSHIGRTATIGFFGGLLWSTIGFIAYYFHFTAFSPAFVLDLFMVGDWKEGALGHLIGILVIAILSIGVAYLYNFILKNIDNVWAGILFGVGLWVIVFFLLKPLFPNVKAVANWELNTIVVTLCLYILYGVFVGYSISFDAKEMAHADQQLKESYSNE